MHSKSNWCVQRSALSTEVLVLFAISTRVLLCIDCSLRVASYTPRKRCVQDHNVPYLYRKRFGELERIGPLSQLFPIGTVCSVLPVASMNVAVAIIKCTPMYNKLLSSCSLCRADLRVHVQNICERVKLPQKTATVLAFPKHLNKGHFLMIHQLSPNRLVVGLMPMGQVP